MSTHTDPSLALKSIEQYDHSLDKSVFKFIDRLETNTTTEQVIDFKISNLLNMIYDQIRFEQVAILVVDYEMPDINGIAFCKKLHESNIYKMMLTAEADKDTVIQAFNEGLIDKFLLKTNKELYSDIASTVQELTQRYFNEISIHLIHKRIALPQGLFSNDAYIQLFTNVVQEVQAIEYFMIDTSGSFLFLDKNANPTWLIVRHSVELEDQLALLRGYEAPDFLTQSIASKEKILFLFSEQEYKKPICEWVDHLYDSTILDNEHHYSVVRGRITDAIDWDRVVSYGDYLEGKCGGTRNKLQVVDLIENYAD